jgi:hypothetical protein
MLAPNENFRPFFPNKFRLFSHGFVFLKSDICLQQVYTLQSDISNLIRMWAYETLWDQLPTQQLLVREPENRKNHLWQSYKRWQKWLVGRRGREGPAPGFG